ncbi:MAG TPA: HEAT repeat domain-containing protein [Planctomycetota bacterium]|nr:HEAT repeat domain-containing protein [Planctomycetota bacterium]
MTDFAAKHLRLLSALLALTGAFILCQPKLSAEEDTAGIEKAFREAVDLYEQGKYAESQIKLKEVQDKDPRSALVARLVDEAGVRTIVKMMADVRMGAAPTRLWEIYRKYNIGKLADKDRMIKMAAKLVDPNTSEDERTLLYAEFAQLGHYAVPYLAPYLKDPTNIQARTYARLAIAQMGPKATLALVELVGHKDQLMRENAILTIGDIIPSDARAIPALKGVIEDAKESEIAKSYAKRILRRLTGLDDAAWKPAAQYYYDAANRYYLDRPGVAEEAEDQAGMIFHLNDAGDLVFVQYPMWAWNEQIAEQEILRGWSLAPDQADFAALWACNSASQATEVDDLLDIANEQPPKHNFSAEEKKELEDWKKKEMDARRLIAVVGKENVNLALNKVHADLKRYPGHVRLPAVGAMLAKELPALDPMGALLDANSALVAGLDSPELGVKYQCAITLATINRFPAPWPGSDKVGDILGHGVAENKNLQILLVEEDANFANAFAARLRDPALNYGVTIVGSGRDAITAARAFPPKDIAIVAENLKTTLNTYQLLEELRAAPETRYLPVGILYNRADRDLIQSRFGTNVALVEREATGADLKAPIDKLAEQRTPTSANKRRANEIAVNCAKTLAMVDASASHINLDQAVPYCTAALIGRGDDVRNPCAVFLGRVAGGSHKDEVAENLKRVFEDMNNAVELRRNAVRSLGRVKVDGLEAVYAKAQSDPDQEIKDLAAEALGQKSRAGKLTLDVIMANRIDKDKKEK